MTIQDREMFIRKEMTEAFEKLFEGVHEEMDALVINLQKAIHHWDNVSASYEELVGFTSLLEHSPDVTDPSKEEAITNELFRLAELNLSLESLYQQTQQDRLAILQSSVF